MAGEATESDFPATVNGAVRSGFRVAQEVLEARGVDSCLVIGAGGSGLAAASQLQKEGCEVIVLEGRDRIGGRAWTDNLQDTPIDLGGSWFHGVDTHVLTPRAKELNIELVPTDYENWILFDFDGGRMNTARLNRLYDLVYDSVIGRSSTDAMGPLLSSIRESLSSEEQRWFDYVVVSEIEHWYAGHVDDLAMATAYEGALSRGGDAVPTTGYGPFMEDLASGLDIRLSTKVTEVSHNSSGVTVTTESESFEAASVVVTLPLGVLQSKTVKFSPELPYSQQVAVDGLGMGLMNKVVLEFEEPFWDVNKDLISYMPTNRGRFVEWYNAMSWTGKPILVGFNTADSAASIETWSDASTLEASLEVLSKMKF
jgi:monoamine oxidase